MTVDSAQAFNAPEEVTLGGETFLLSQLKMKEWAAVQGWLKSRCPSPLVRAARAIEEAEAAGTPLSRRVQDTMLGQAQEAVLRWPPKPGSWHWFNLLDGTEGGMAKFLQTIVARHRPGFTEAEAEALLSRAADVELADAVRVSTFGDPPAPKSPGATETAEREPVAPDASPNSRSTTAPGGVIS
jgi:hypothetical protein